MIVVDVTNNIGKEKDDQQRTAERDDVSEQDSAVETRRETWRRRTDGTQKTPCSDEGRSVRNISESDRGHHQRK